jgi:RNA polymerase sigma-32 factor
MDDADSYAIRALLRRSTLTAERERQLLRTRRFSGDETERHLALTELWESHSRLVVALARQYSRSGVAMVDLVGAGQLGMHAAIEHFDPDRFDCRLSTYAARWIRYYIQDYIRRSAFPLRLPASTAFRQLFRSTRRLFADARRQCERDGVEPTDAELHARVGARIGLSGEDVGLCLRLARGEVLSLDGRFGETEARGLQNRLAAPEATPEEAVILHLDHAKLRARVVALCKEVLGERERKVFFARCLAGDEGPRHRTILAAELGVSRERIYQLEASAKRKIITALAHDGLIADDTAAIDLPKVRAPRRFRRAAAPVD